MDVYYNNKILQLKRKCNFFKYGFYLTSDMFYFLDYLDDEFPYLGYAVSKGQIKILGDVNVEDLTKILTECKKKNAKLYSEGEEYIIEVKDDLSFINKDIKRD